ncbi:hypothetical protein HZ346_003925 [Salmonella enterica]|nr:hypothetical protein [Salmonella enterica]
MRNNTLSALIVYHGDSLLHRSGWPETVGVTQVAPGVVPGWLAVCGVLSADEILTLVNEQEEGIEGCGVITDCLRFPGAPSRRWLDRRVLREVVNEARLISHSDSEC